MPREDYYERQADKAERLRDRAEKTKTEADNRGKWVRQMVDGLNGQPILVGHHSEKGHRKLLDRIDNSMRAAHEGTEKAKELNRRANNAEAASEGHGAVSSDAPDAIERLREELANRQASQEAMKKANRVYAKGGRWPEGWKAVQAAGILKEKELQSAMRTHKVCHYERGKAFPGYALTNNNGNIRRIKARIAELEAEQAREAEPELKIEGEGWQVFEDREENRVCVYFEQRQPQETAQTLKRHGFRWSRYHGRWQRLNNGNGRWAAKTVAGKLGAKA